MIRPIVHRSERGVVLAVVLWTLALLSLMAAGFSRSARTETILAAYHAQAAQARAIAEAGVWLGVRDLLRPVEEREMDTAGRPSEIELGRGRIALSIQNESGRIDLNRGSDELLLGVLRAAGLPDSEAQSVTDAVLEWRVRAEPEDGRVEDLTLWHGPFRSVDELRLIPGMTEDLFRKIAPAFTVFSHTPAVDPVTAVPTVRAVLQGSEGTLPTDGSVDVEEIDDAPEIARSGGRIFTISSEGAVDDSRVRIDAVVLLQRGAAPPYAVLSWTEGPGIEASGEKGDEP